MVNADLRSPWHNTNDPGNDLSALTAATYELKGTPFRIDGIVQVQSSELAAKRPDFLTESGKIIVGRKVVRLHFLHGTGWIESEGQLIGKFLVEYADGSVHAIPIRDGQDVRNWQFWPEAVRAEPAGVSKPVWSGPQKRWNEYWPEWGGRLYRLSWSNPKADIPITSIRLVSTMSKSCPFVLAITGDDRVPH